MKKNGRGTDLPRPICSQMLLRLLHVLATPVTLPEEIFPALQAQNASLAGFLAGETATVRDLLYRAMLPSGAGVLRSAGPEVSGSEEALRPG